MEFTFDQHKETQYDAGLLYDWLSHYKTEIVEKVSFDTRREPGIQAADLWARELMKRCDPYYSTIDLTPGRNGSTLAIPEGLRLTSCAAQNLRTT